VSCALPRRRFANRDHADAFSACSNAAGSAFPRLAARRRMPAHALGESQYFGGINAAGSSSEDKDSNAPLGGAEVLQIEHAECGHGFTSCCHTAAAPSVRGNRDGGSHEG